MIDLIYVLATVSFFALMMLYVAACDRIGRSADAGRVEEPRS
jgi:hypothetical protein